MSHGVGTHVPLYAVPRGRIPVQRRRFAVVTDRDGYWFPMLVFGLLILVAPLVYRPSGPSDVDSVWNPVVNSSSRISGVAFAPLQQFGTCDSALGDPMSVALYWFCVVMFAPLASMLWYHRRARRNGSPPLTGWYLLYASTSLALYVVLFPVIEFVMLHVPDAIGPPSRSTVLLLDIGTVGGFVAGLTVAAFGALPLRYGRRLSSARWVVTGLGMLLAIAAAAAIEFVTYVAPKPSYGALLIIAVALLALSLVERGRTCFVVAVLFTVASLVANLVGFAGWWSALGAGSSAFATAVGNLALPAIILLAGAGVGGWATMAARPGRTS
ncbi:MAG TPA: hypothetical protein VHV74_16530 [Pseudonocardiaceae bacterium]|jgi:hypothetical protein|nr:hypothetical protein [Pseudonocardiaceae bacterium]